MRALGIPNNKNFYEVTQIEEAKSLWANIQVRPALLTSLPVAYIRAACWLPGLRSVVCSCTAWSKGSRVLGRVVCGIGAPPGDALHSGVLRRGARL